MSSQVLSIGQIYSLFKGEWILVEDPEVDDLRAKPFQIFGGVCIFDPYQDQQSLFYGRSYYTFYRYGSMVDALDDGSHFSREDNVPKTRFKKM